MRNVSIDVLDDTPRRVVAIGTDYAYGQVLPRHTHRRAQLLYGATGVMQVSTHDGNWVVPPQRAVWIPPGMAHEVLMLGVSTRSVYIEPGVVDLGGRCQVINVSPLMRHLLMEAAEVAPVYDETGRDGALIDLLLHELARSAHRVVPAVSAAARCSSVAAAMGESNARQPAHVQSPVSPANRPELQPMATACLCSAGACPTGRG
jgi:hypothetical protein